MLRNSVGQCLGKMGFISDQTETKVSDARWHACVPFYTNEIVTIFPATNFSRSQLLLIKLLMPSMPKAMFWIDWEQIAGVATMYSAISGSCLPNILVFLISTIHHTETDQILVWYWSSESQIFKAMYELHVMIKFYNIQVHAEISIWLTLNLFLARPIVPGHSGQGHAHESHL